ncbi:5'/3'-nucleotidase SurE [Halioglobus japonicus]|nr:5'/3'-nucleotidase SurE [Halioglobus japonicus]
MKLRIAAALAVFVLSLTACSNSSNNSNDSDQPNQTLTILVTNDDGIGAPGIDALVNQLIELNNVDVKVVAPAENQSGSSDKTTDGDVVWADSATVSGYSGVAVYGYPADAVNVALDQLDIVPNLIVSGVNSGQNVGPFAPLSGTVGAAQTGARAGFPAVAGSAGLGEDADFGAAVDLVINWIAENRSALADGTSSTETVTSFNVPDCTEGSIRELVEVPRADSIPQGVNVFFTDCAIEPESLPTTDVDAMVKGFAAQTQLPLYF